MTGQRGKHVQVTKPLEANLRLVSRRSRPSEIVRGPQGATGCDEPAGGEHQVRMALARLQGCWDIRWRTDAAPWATVRLWGDGGELVLCTNQRKRRKADGVQIQ